MALVEECHRAGLSSPSLVSCCAGALPMMDPSWPSKAAGSPCSSAMLKPAFTVMGRPAARATSCRGGRSRLLGRCFTVSAQTGDVSLVTLALQCRADIEQRINGHKRPGLGVAGRAGAHRRGAVASPRVSDSDGAGPMDSADACSAGLRLHPRSSMFRSCVRKLLGSEPFVGKHSVPESPSLKETRLRSWAKFRSAGGTSQSLRAALSLRSRPRRVGRADNCLGCGGVPFALGGPKSSRGFFAEF